MNRGQTVHGFTKSVYGAIRRDFVTSSNTRRELGSPIRARKLGSNAD